VIGSKFSLRDNIAIVTGGSRGIGKAIALGLAQAGADVVICSRRLPELEKVAEQIKQMGRKSLAIMAHMGKKEDIENVVNQAVKEFNCIHILVNNVGINPVMKSMEEITEEEWDKIMDVNLKGYFLMSQAVAKIMMRQKKGSIINITSVGGFRASPGLGVYCVSKAGIIMLTKVLAKEWGSYGIRVNAIGPGLVRTKLSQALWTNPKIMAETEKNTPLGRIAEPEDIVGATIFLASDASSYITGETLFVDGGSLC